VQARSVSESRLTLRPRRYRCLCASQKLSARAFWEAQNIYSLTMASAVAPQTIRSLRPLAVLVVGRRARVFVTLSCISHPCCRSPAASAYHARVLHLAT
jgi:hypothetical protein